MKVHRELGAGFLEAVYQEAVEREFVKNNIPYEREKRLHIFYEGEKMNKTYRADFLCYDKIVVELKVAQFIPKGHYKQTRNYLKATKYRLGILVNFGKPSLEYQRILNKIT